MLHAQQQHDAQICVPKTCMEAQANHSGSSNVALYFACFLLQNFWSIPRKERSKQDKMLLLDCMLCGEEAMPSSVLEKQFAHWQQQLLNK